MNERVLRRKLQKKFKRMQRYTRCQLCGEDYAKLVKGARQCIRSCSKCKWVRYYPLCGKVQELAD